MNVLWLSPTPCNAKKILQDKLPIGGWLESLEYELKERKNINLSVCFFCDKQIKPFFFEGVHYYPVYRSIPKNKVKALMTRYKHLIFPPKDDVSPFLDVIKMVNPDVIHIHGSESNYGLIQCHTDVPCILSIQSIINPYSEKFFSGIPLAEASKHERLFDKLILSSAKRQYHMFKKIAKNEKIIYANTKNIMGRTDWDYRISRILSPKSRYFHGDEILRPLFYINRWNKTSFSQPLQIVTTMSGGLYKGLESVIKTAEILTDYGLKFKWNIIGQSVNDPYVQMNKNWLKVDYNSINIFLMGRKSADKLVSILLSSDIFCQVSHIENSPNSLCEAMLLGMPIIATMAGGTDSLLTNKVDGIIVQDGDSYSLAGAILEMSKNFNQASAYGINAYNKAFQRHNQTKITDEVIGAYNAIIK